MHCFTYNFLCVPSQVTSSARQLDIVSTLRLFQILISGDNTQALINQYGRFLIALYVHVYVCLKKTVTSSSMMPFNHKKNNVNSSNLIKFRVSTQTNVARCACQNLRPQNSRLQAVYLHCQKTCIWLYSKISPKIYY